MCIRDRGPDVGTVAVNAVVALAADKAGVPPIRGDLEGGKEAEIQKVTQFHFLHMNTSLEHDGKSGGHSREYPPLWSVSAAPHNAEHGTAPVDLSSDGEQKRGAVHWASGFFAGHGGISREVGAYV